MQRDETLEGLLQIRGATKRIAEGLGISTAAVSQWQRVPEGRVEQVATILGIAPSQVRPDLFPPTDAEAA